MIQEKKCKGQGKAKSVKGCGKLVKVKYRKYGLCTSCYADFILNTDYGKLLLEKATLKATKQRRELETATKEKKNREGLTTLLESVKKVCHDYIKLRDKGKPCISCGHPWHSEHQAGHFYKAELYSNLKFHELNINGQCVRCNIRLEGNLNPYAINLENKIGKWKFNVLKAEAEQYNKNGFKWDREVLKSIRTNYRNKIKKLKL